MPPSSRIPPLLAPHVHLPTEDSLLLVTSTLGASANWLLTRFLCNALTSATPSGAATALGVNNGEEIVNSDDVNVLMVSWMREYDFWKQESRKGAGVDLERARREGRFAFVDGLTGLFSTLEQESKGDERNSNVRNITQPLTAARLGSTVPARGAPPSSAVASTTTTTTTRTTNTTIPILKSPDLTHLKTTLQSTLSTLSPHRKTLLILDNPDILLATAPPTSPLTPSSLTSLILTLHADPRISHILVHVQSDNAVLGGLSAQLQPMEVMQRNLVVKVAHMSRRVLGVRVLDTGVARDVSGVLRVTENEGVVLARGGDEGDEERYGREMLYKVNGDGSVRVFERGAGGDG